MRVEEGYAWRWLAGDVVEIDVFESEGIYRRSTHRLYGMNAPHPGGMTRDMAEKARERMEDLTRGRNLRFCYVDIPERHLLAPCFRKYGRRLVRVFFEDGTELCEIAIAEGLGVPHYMGLGRRPNPLVGSPRRGRKKRKAEVSKSMTAAMQVPKSTSNAESTLGRET